MKLFAECEVCDARAEVELSYDDVYIVDNRWYDHYSLGSYCPDHYPGQLDRQYGPITQRQDEDAKRIIGKNSIFGVIYDAMVEEQLKAGPVFNNLNHKIIKDGDSIQFPTGSIKFTLE